MQYLITYNVNGKQLAFWTNWFDVENNFTENIGMVVFDLVHNKFMANSSGWSDIDEDHL